MKLTCNKCGKEFTIKQDMLKESYLGAMITETSFSCPKCGEKYFVCIQNTKSRRLQRKIEELREIIRDKHIKKEYPIPEVLESEELSKELKKEMNRINGKKISLADFVATLEFKGTDKIKQDLKEIEDSSDRILSKHKELTNAYEIVKPVADACGVTYKELIEVLRKCKDGVIKA